MRVNVVAAAIVLGSWAGLGLGLGGCVDECPRIRQHVFVVEAEPDLQALIDGCRASRTAGDGTCQATDASSPIACGCLPLCRRLLEIADQFPGEEAITGCELSSGTIVDAGSDSRIADVVVTYRPSSCP